MLINDFGYALGAVQMGATPPQAKSCKGEGTAVWELVESHRGDIRGDMFRAIYTVRYAKAVYVAALPSEKISQRQPILLKATLT